MRKAIQYLWDCAAVALRLTWRIADTVGVVIGIVLAIAVIALPDQQQSIGQMLAKLTVWILAAVFIGRFLSAPYVLYRGRDIELSVRDKQISELQGKVSGLEDLAKQHAANNRLADFLQRQADLGRKGSLSNRANLLAQDILKLEADRREDSNRVHERRSRAVTEEERNAAWAESNKLYEEQHRKTMQLLNGKLVPRVVIIAEELNNHELSDAELDSWLEHPHVAGMQLERVGASLATLAAKMGDIETNGGSSLMEGGDSLL